MDHVVYLDAKAEELTRLLQGEKTMIIRGAAGRKIPYGRVNVGDMLYLMENDAKGMVKAKAEVSFVYNSEKMEKDQSIALVETYQDRLQLTGVQTKRWAGKRYLVMMELISLVPLEPFKIDKSGFGNMDDWLPVEDIHRVKIVP